MDSEVSPSRQTWKYDVFLSFRPEDTSYNFTCYLYFALLRLEVKTLVHDQIDEYCPPNLLKAIEESRISVVVFSRNYVASTRCLEELARIVHCIDLVEQFVCPVFYGVNPSEIRRQTGFCRQVFAEYEIRFKEDLDKVKRWRNAMTKVASLAGFDVPQNRGNKTVLYRIIRISQHILGDKASSITDELLGIPPQVEELENLLDLDSDDVIRVIGICGEAGSGKTTVASVLYHKISHKFDAFCFLANKYSTTSWKDACCLQEQLLRQILRQDNVKISDVQQGISLTSTMLRNLRILIVLRGFNHVEILKELVGNYDWFGVGSRIIITARSEEMLKRCRVDGIYRVKLLNDEDNPLFTLHALGDEQKQIFLDISCFFVGKKINKVKEILCHCEFYPASGIEFLIKKSFITIPDQRIQMHYMLQEMGLKSVEQESLKDPGKRSRLWLIEDFRHVVENDTGTENIKAVVLNPKVLQETPLRAEAVSKMNGLRLLIIRNLTFSGVLNGLSNHLRYVSWHRFPFTCLPSSFEPDRLVQLIMRDSNITQLWKELRTMLPRLRSMDLCGSRNLMEMPDFERLPNLEKLNLEECIGLVLLDPSMAFLTKLKFLNLRNCTSLVSVPNNLFGLSSLEILNFAGCSKFAEILDFDDRRSSIEGEALTNQDLSLLEERGKQLLACGNPFIQIPGDCKSKKEARSSQMEDAPKACVASEIKAETHLAVVEIYSAKSIEGTSSTISAAEYPIGKCIVALDEIDGVPDNSYMKALEKFKDPYWREVFLTMSQKRKKAWLNNLV